ncbi:hypothetical protein B0H67DRAFT_604590 [Lasiosphaeris hirsuta]|uniref:Short-chain dehydrogenase/reductase n=1 Tax=Lasiosphaeris hirsuta TaxID=260670 RepID=A0AA40DG69_9PEZI|nr:hypothetical protein B0H67DRAFT_604590 [Lasiosphaeris hirsuta]
MNPVNTMDTRSLTGCSSGIGREIATLVTRKPSQRLIAAARSAFAAAAKHFGDNFYLDVVVNNGGYSLSGDTEAVTEEEVHQEMETLFFGTARVTMRAVEVMRQAKDRWGGLISVAREMDPDCNIHFCIIEPGAVKTNFEGHSKAHTKLHPAYANPSMPLRQLEIPLRATLGPVAWQLAKSKFEGLLQEFDAVKELSSLGQGI